MKILALQPYGDDVGHFSKYTVRLCHEIARLGHEVVLYTNLINPADYLTEPPAFRLEQLGPKYSFFPIAQKGSDSSVSSAFVLMLGRMRNNVAVLRRALRLVERERFDVVQLFGYYIVSTWLFFELHHPVRFPPVVMEISGAGFSLDKCYGSRAKRFWYQLERMALRRLLGTYIQAVNVNSASHVPELRKQLGLPEDFIIECVGDTREIPHTPLDKFEARKRIGLGDYRGCVFLFFGTIRKEKGLDNLLKAFGMLSEECRLLIAGMPLRWSASDEARCILSDPRVIARFEYIPEQEIDAYFYASDALVLPYRWFYTESSGPLYEAGARGLPVIVSDVSEMGRLTRERNLGLVVPPEDPEALADALRQFIMLDQAQKAQWSANALALVRENDRSTIAKRFVGLYERLLALP